MSLKEAFIVLRMTLEDILLGIVFRIPPEGGDTLMVLLRYLQQFFAGMWSLPYGSRWLALKGRTEEAQESMRFVSPDITEEEIEEMLRAADQAAKLQKRYDEEGDHDGERDDANATHFPFCSRLANGVIREWRRFQPPASESCS